MTRFVADAIGHRKGGGGGGGSNEKARQQALEEYRRTGVHPAAQAAAEAPVPLPPADPSRPHVFLDLALDSRPLGRAAVEVFEDVVPLAASQFLRRCSRGSAHPLAGCAAHRLVRAHDVSFPSSSSLASSSSSSSATAATVDANAAARRTRFSAVGVVGVSRDGFGGVAISLGRAPGLDGTHLVVGRVVGWANEAAAAATPATAPAAAFADTINAVRTDPATDAPRGRLVVARTGRCASDGAAMDEGEEETGGGKATDLRAAAKEVKATVDDALKEGLGRQRAGGGTAGAAVETGAAAAAASRPAPPAKRQRRTMLDALSGSEDDDEDEDEDDDD
jgi:hypothetical protein